MVKISIDKEGGGVYYGGSLKNFELKWGKSELSRGKIGWKAAYNIWTEAKRASLLCVGGKARQEKGESC